MNSENPIDPRQALEPSLTALLLGELPEDQARFVRQALATDPELAKTFERLRQTTALIRQTEVHPTEEPAAPPILPRLSDARRQELLSRFKTVRPEKFKFPVFRTSSWLVAAAAVLVLTLLLASALLPVLSRSKSRSMAELSKTEVETVLRRKWANSSSAAAAPETGGASHEVVLSRAQRQLSERESLRRSTITSASSDDRTAQSIAGKPLDSSAGFQQRLANIQMEKLAAENTELARAASSPATPAAAPVQQTIVLPTVPESEQQSASAANGQLITGDWNLYTESTPPASAAGVPAREPSQSDSTFTYSTFGRGFGGMSGPATPGQQQVPVLGDAPIVGKRFSQSKDTAGQGTAQAAQNAPGQDSNQQGRGSGRPEQSAGGVLGVGGIAGGPSGSKLTIANEATEGKRDFAGQLADAVKLQGAANFNKSADDLNASARARTLPALQKESQAGDKLSEAEIGQQLALADSLLGQGKANNQPQKEALISLNTQQEMLKKQPSEPVSIAIQGMGDVPPGPLTNLLAKGQELDARAEGRVDQQDRGAAKPALQAPVPQPEIQTRENAFSTFSLNVSDVSFKLAAASLEQGKLPDPAGIRSEEFINAFDYRDPEAAGGQPVAFAWERARYPFAQNRDLLRFSIKTAAAGRQPGRPLNLVVLLDNSGSMERADRVRIIREALRVLASQLQASDTLSVVTFARTARLWADGVPGNQAGRVVDQLSGLTPQGGTNLEEAMNLAYQTALRHYLPSGINRVVLLTDGAANLGDTDPEALKRKVEANRQQGIALDCFGIGWEGYNDDLLEVLTRNGDGRYGFLNAPEEAATEFAGQLAGALKVAASDVKVQVEFNSNRVTSYRQIGYARHQLTKEQFRDNTLNAASIGAAESGNALYLIESNPQGDGPIATVRVRYRTPGTVEYHEQEWAVPYTGTAVSLEQASPAMRLAATAAAFSEWLATSPYAAEVTPDRLLSYLGGVSSVYAADPRPQKLEWMIRQAKALSGK